MPKTSRRKQDKPQHLANDEHDETGSVKKDNKELISDNNGNIITTRSRSTRSHKNSNSPLKSDSLDLKKKSVNLESKDIVSNGDEGISSDDEDDGDNKCIAKDHGSSVACNDEHEEENNILNKDSIREKSQVVDCDSVGQISENNKIDMGTEDAVTSDRVNFESGNSGAYNPYISQINNFDRRNYMNDHRISKNDIGKHLQDHDAGSPDVVMYDDMEDEPENNSDSGIVLSPSPHLANRTCEYCGAIKKSPADLQRHLRKHTGERPFICEVCNRAFKAKRSLQNHQVSQHRMHKMAHLRRSNNIVAQYPDGSLALKHKLNTLYSPESTQSKRFRSDDESHGDQDSVSSNSPVGSLRESPESGIEMTENGRDRVCHICGKVCLKPSDLRRHMMCHTGEKPFKCDICGKPFRAKNSMHYHMKASHGVNVELSPGLQERYMRLKKQSRINTLMSQLGNAEQDSGNTNSCPDIPQSSSNLDFANFTTQSSSFHYNNSMPSNSSIVGRASDAPSLDDSKKKERSDSTCSISNFTDGKAVLDPETGLFKHLGYYIDPSNIPEADNDGTIQLVKPGKSLVGTEIVQESPFCKSRISVKNETVLVTRIDGINLVSGNETSLFKCYLCGKVFNHLAQIQCHLSMHFVKDIVVYECQVCHDTFWFKFQVIQHIRKKHPNELRNRSSSSSTSADIKTEISNDEDSCKHSSNANLDQSCENTSSENPDHSCENTSSENPDHSCENSSNRNPDHSCENSSNEEKGSGNTSENISSESLDQEDVQNDESKQIDEESILCQLYRGLKYRKNSNGSYICVICRKSFFREKSLLKHIQIHSGKSLYYCEDCGQGFNVYSHLRQHIIQVHGSKTDSSATSESATRSLLSSLLKKSNQNWSPTAPVLSLEIEREKENLEKEKAKAFLESEGIKEDIEVVLPCDPEESSLEDVNKPDEQKSWSESESEIENDDESEKDGDGKNSEIMVSPRTTMLSKLTKVLNKRKSKMPIHIKKESEAANEKEDEKPIRKENVTPENPTPAFIPPVPMPGLPIIPPMMVNGGLTMPPLTSQGLLNPALNSVLFANSLAASGNVQQLMQEAASGNVQQYLQGAALAASAAAAAAASGNTQQFLQGAAYLPALAAGLQMNPMMGMPISVKVPSQEQENLSVKKEPSSESPSPSSSNPDSGNKSSTAESSSADPSPNHTGSGDREQLVGYPRVQWSPSSEGSKQQNLNWNQLALNQISSDGRKVTSLSRTHSRLYVVNTPVNREKVCKPTTLSDGRIVYKCPVCVKHFLSYSDINRHMDFHEDIRPYKCNFCEYYARTNSQLKVHMMRHQGIREFCCKLCNYKGVTQSDLNRHMKSQIHLLKSRNSCKHCGEGFVTAKNLERHTNGNCIVKVQAENGLGI